MITLELLNVVFNYVCLSLCTQPSEEQCFSDGHYSVIGGQSKDVPQPFKMHTEIKGDQVCVSVLDCLLLCVVFFVCACMHV